MFQTCDDYLSYIEAKHEERYEGHVGVAVNPVIVQNCSH